MRRVEPSGPRALGGRGVARGPTLDRFWLRPAPVFERVGPLYPAGTFVSVLGRAVARRGRLSLYPVSVLAGPSGAPGYAEGWAALSEADVASVLGSLNDVPLLASYGKSLDGKLAPEAR